MIGVSETRINRTENHSFGDYCYPIDGTILDGTLSNLYRYGLSEFGRCIGKVYIDTNEGTKHIGYTFLKRERYEDSAETYLAETWVSVGEYHSAISEHISY